MNDNLALFLFYGVILGIMYLFENDSVRFFLAFLPIFVILAALTYSKIQSEVRILFLVVRNIFKASAKQRLNSAPDSHQVAFISAYRGHLLKVFLLTVILAFVSYQLTVLISPLLLIHSRELGEILGAVFVAGTLYAVALFLLSEKVDEPFKAKVMAASVIVIFVASFYYAVEAFLIVVAAEFYVFDWINKKNHGR